MVYEGCDYVSLADFDVFGSCKWWMVSVGAILFGEVKPKDVEKECFCQKIFSPNHRKLLKSEPNLPGKAVLGELRLMVQKSCTS